MLNTYAEHGNKVNEIFKFNLGREATPDEIVNFSREIANGGTQDIIRYFGDWKMRMLAMPLEAIH